MEETLFEYRYEENEENLKEYLNFIHFKAPSRIVFFALCVLIVATYACITVKSFILGESGRFLFLTLTLVIAALFLFVVFYGYFRAGRQTKKMLAELYGDNPPVMEAYVTEDKIRLVNVSNHAEGVIEIPSVAKVYEQKSILILRTKAKVSYVFSKNGFTKGTSEEFMQFLFSKGVKCIK